MITNIKNLNINKKILIAPILTIFFLVSLAIFSYIALNKGKYTVKNLVTVKMYTQSMNLKMISELRMVNGRLYKMFNLKSAGFDKINLDSFEAKHRTAILKVEKDFYNILNDPNIENSSKITYKKLYKEYKKYRRVAIDSLDIMHFDVNTGFMLFYGAHDIYISMLTTLRENIKISSKQNTQAYEDSIALNKLIITMLLILIFISIVTSIFVSLKVSNSIKKPLSELKNGLTEFFEYLSHNKDDVKPISIYANDEIGCMSKDINKNIQKIKSDLEMDNKMINNLISCVSSVNDGYLDAKIVEEPNQKELKKVKDFFNSMLKTLEQSIGQDISVILKTLDDYKAHNYNSNIKDANGTVEVAVNELGDTIRKMLKDNLDTGNILQDKAFTLFSNIDALKINTTIQKNLVNDSSKQLEEITSRLIEQVINASKMASYSDEVTLSANSGTSLANKTTQAMENMDTMVDEINKSINIIDEIVIKTNILSLNASVEAVSAGEAGKGFVVVAKEVRNLANQSSDASDKIKKIVNEAKNKASDGKQIVGDMMQGYNALLENIKNTTVLINESISISNKQESSILNIGDMIKLLDQQSNKTSTIAKESQSIASQTNTIAQKIVNDVKEHSF